MNFPISILLANTASTLFMTGLIWFVQIVHYPLFESVAAEGFREYANKHCALTSYVVVPPMLIELITAGVLVFVCRQSESAIMWSALIIVIAIWICTALFSIPAHQHFCSSGFDRLTCSHLIATNWARTILWTLRSFIMMYVVFKRCII